MKRVVILLACLMLLAGCGSNKKEVIPPQDDQMIADIEASLGNGNVVNGILQSQELLEKDTRFSAYWLVDVEEGGKIETYSCHLLYNYFAINDLWKMQYCFNEIVEHGTVNGSGTDIMTDTSSGDSSGESIAGIEKSHTNVKLYGMESLSDTRCSYREDAVSRLENKEYKDVLYFSPLNRSDDSYIEYYLGGEYTNLSFIYAPSDSGWPNRESRAEFCIAIMNERGDIIDTVDSIKYNTKATKKDVNVAGVDIVRIAVYSVDGRYDVTYSYNIFIAEAELRYDESNISNNVPNDEGYYLYDAKDIASFQFRKDETYKILNGEIWHKVLLTLTDGFDSRRSYIEYYVDDEYNHLAGDIAPGEYYNAKGLTTKIYILQDDNVIYTSEEISSNTEPIHFSVDVDGGSSIRIEMEESPGRSVTDSADYVVIGNLKLTK